MNHNSCLLNFLVIALCFFLTLKFFPVHISKTKQAMVMKFCGWIDLIKAECNAQEP